MSSITNITHSKTDDLFIKSMCNYCYFELLTNTSNIPIIIKRQIRHYGFHIKIKFMKKILIKREVTRIRKFVNDPQSVTISNHKLGYTDGDLAVLVLY